MAIPIRRSIVGLALAAALSCGGEAGAAPSAGGEPSVTELQAQMASGRTSSEMLTRTYLDRIRRIDTQGPALHSVIALNPDAVAEARALDAERRAGRVRGPLHGVPVLIKDNIETADRMATTGGSLALSQNFASRDAALVARLRAAGAVILGKTNLSEWANIRSERSISGWSGVGGLVKNPYVLDRNACGSSSGTGAAVAADLAAVGVGTETDGSITCPSSVNGVVGLKPTVGLVSRTRVIPISHSQDTAGPMARTVGDAAILLTAMAGSDPADPATAGADAHKTDYFAALAGASLRGKRLGVLRYAAEASPPELALFEAALATLRAQGAEIVEITDYHPPRSLGGDEFKVLMTELKVDLNKYLAGTDSARVRPRTLAELIAFNAGDRRELALFGQDEFVISQATTGLSDPAYIKARAASLKAAGADGIDALLSEHRLDALIAPTTGPAWKTDAVDGDHVEGEGATSLAAIAGYPHLTVPMGYVRGLPVGLSFMAGAWQEADLLRLGYAYEQASRLREAPSYIPSLETSAEIAPLFAPSRDAATSSSRH